MKTERNLINELRIEEIFNKIQKNKITKKTLENFQFENNYWWLTEENRILIVHHFEKMNITN